MTSKIKYRHLQGIPKVQKPKRYFEGILEKKEKVQVEREVSRLAWEGDIWDDFTDRLQISTEQKVGRKHSACFEACAGDDFGWYTG